MQLSMKKHTRLQIVLLVIFTLDSFAAVDLFAGVQKFKPKGYSLINSATNNMSHARKTEVAKVGFNRYNTTFDYSTGCVGGNILSNTTSSNIITPISGRVAGAYIVASSGQLGGASKINIRGSSSLAGSNQPLFIIDGMPVYSGDYMSSYNIGNLTNDINYSDIESINVLKGVASTAIYGSRGVNGVIFITTKRGAGKGVDNFAVELQSSVVLDKVSIMPKLQSVYGGGYKSVFNTKIIDGEEYNIPEYRAAASWGPKLDGSPYLAWNALDEYDTDNYMKPRAWEYPANDYTTIFNSGISYSNSISIAGSSSRHSYRLSYSNLNQTGIMDMSTSGRNTLSLSASATHNDNIDSWITANYSATDAQGRQNVGYEADNITKNIFQSSQMQLDFVELQEYISPDGEQRGWNRMDFANSSVVSVDNPYWTLNKNYQSDSRSRLFGNVGVNVGVIDNLKFTARIGVDRWSFNAEERMAIGSLDGSSYSLIDNKSVEYNGDILARYSNRFVDDIFGVSALVGFNSSVLEYSSSGGVTSGGLVAADIYSLYNSKGRAILYDQEVDSRVNSFYGDVTFDWKQLIYLNISARSEKSTMVSSSAESPLYPALNGSFVLSRLPIVKDLKWLNFAKIRGGYAASSGGNNAYALGGYHTASTPFSSNPEFDLHSTLGRSDIEMESVKLWEVGFEAQLFDGLFGVDISYYERTAANQIIPTYGGVYSDDLTSGDLLSGGLTFGGSTSGGSSPEQATQFINAGELFSSGVEVTITGVPISDFGGVRWESTVNITTLNSKVKSIASDIDYITLANTAYTASSKAVVGESYPIIYGTDYLYDNNGEKLIGSDGRYLVSPDTKPLAKATPDFMLGFSNTFTYKNIHLSILFDMQMGGSMYYLSNALGMYYGVLPGTVIASNVAGKNGDIREDGYILNGVYGTLNQAGEPEYINADGTPASKAVENTTIISGSQYGRSFRGLDAANVFSTNYIKLRELSLGYTVDNKYTGVVKNLKVSAFGRNLATFMTSQKHFDPEYVTSATANGLGLETGYIPTTATYGFTISCGF